MICIIQNDPAVPPGLLTTELDHFGYPWFLVQPYRDEKLPSVSGFEALIVLGGAMSVCDDATYPFLAEIKILIRATVSQAVPFLGICLGGQLLADTLGGKVTGGRYGEKGIYPVLLTEEGQNDRLFSGIPDQFLSFQWHDDSFDLPSNGIRLACSEGCPNQAFRVGPCAWGTQFHPEVDEKIVREWSSWTESTAAQTEEFAAAYCEQEKAYQMIVHRMMCNFIAVIRDPSGITDPGNARH